MAGTSKLNIWMKKIGFKATSIKRNQVYSTIKQGMGNGERNIFMWFEALLVVQVVEVRSKMGQARRNVLNTMLFVFCSL